MPVPQQSLPEAQFEGMTAPPNNEPWDQGAPELGGGEVVSMNPA